jgi:hypothetical protein
MLLTTNFLELGVVAARVISWQVVNMPSPCRREPAMAFRGRFQKGIFVAWQGNGRRTAGERHGNCMACVIQTRPHYVNQMGKTQSKALAERHGRGTAGEQQGNGMGTAWYV